MDIDPITRLYVSLSNFQESCWMSRGIKLIAACASVLDKTGTEYSPQWCCWVCWCKLIMYSNPLCWHTTSMEPPPPEFFINPPEIAFAWLMQNCRCTDAHGKHSPWWSWQVYLKTHPTITQGQLFHSGKKPLRTLLMTAQDSLSSSKRHMACNYPITCIPEQLEKISGNRVSMGNVCAYNGARHLWRIYVALRCHPQVGKFSACSHEFFPSSLNTV